MPLAPIVLFTYKRPEHTRKVLEALQNNTLASKSNLYVFSDGPKVNASERDLANIEQTRKIIKAANWCNEVNIIESKINLGLQKSIIQGVTEIVNKFGKVIVLEDDIITSKYFLEYMNEALHVYNDEPKVLSIGAFNFFATDNSVPETFFVPVPDCWGWATWKDRWQLFETNAQMLLNKLRERGLIEKFNLNGAYNFENMLIDQIKGNISSWAIRWQALAYLEDRLTLYPRYSVTKNIGFDEGGTHTTEDRYNDNIKFAYNKIQVLKINPETTEALQKRLESGYRTISQPKFNLQIKQRIIQYIKYFLPPALYFLMNKIKERSIDRKKSNSMWEGNYASWSEALAASTGYDAPAILEKVKSATMKVKNGEAAYERDSVIFEEIQHSWPLLACFLKIAIENGNELDVLDFGGSLGSSYFQNKDFLKALKRIRWSVVEQNHFVQLGKEEIADDHLNFYYSIEEASQPIKPKVLLLSSVLQYLENPYEWLDKYIQYDFDYIIIDKTVFIENSEERLTLQNVPESIYKASYPCWFFNDKSFLKRFEGCYKLISQFESYPDFMIYFESPIFARYKGFLFEKLKS